MVLYAKWRTSGGGGGTTPPPEPPGPFIDEHIAYIIGYPQGDVRPGRDITRAEVATVFFRLLTEDQRNANWTQSNSFSDVGAGEWYNTAVSVMSGMGIVNGYPDGTFRPNASIKRAELATIAARFADKMETSQTNNLSFSDIAGHWAEDNINRAASIGWVNGYGDGKFRPDQNITRAEFMTLVNRMLRRVPETGEDLLPSEMIVWSDNANTEIWYYLAVQEATNSHVSQYKDKPVPGMQFNYEHWIEMLPNPDWAALERTWAAANTQ
jgi:hypothetical protein